MPVTIVRQAGIGDVSACIEVQSSRKDTFFGESDYVNAIDDKDVICLVAESGGRLVGYILGYVNPTKWGEAMIQSTMVHSSYGHRGIGSMLAQAFADRAFKRGVKHVFAEVEAGPDRFYEKCGFKEVREWHSMQLSSSA